MSCLLDSPCSLPKVKNGFVVFGHSTLIIRLNEMGNPFKQKMSILVRQRDVIRISAEQLDVFLR